MPIMNSMFIIRWYHVVVLMVKSNKTFLVFHKKKCCEFLRRAYNNVQELMIRRSII